MISKKEQLSAKHIHAKFGISLVNLFSLLEKLSLSAWPATRLKSGQVIHFCKRNVSANNKWRDISG